MAKIGGKAYTVKISFIRMARLVECVIANGTIGGGAEAADCEEKFSHENVLRRHFPLRRAGAYGSETID